jgi:hypothetical protein
MTWQPHHTQARLGDEQDGPADAGGDDAAPRPLKGPSEVDTLNLSGGAWGDVGADALATALRSSPLLRGGGLRRLLLTGCDLSDAEAAAICSALAGSGGAAGLRRLALGGNPGARTDREGGRNTEASQLDSC